MTILITLRKIAKAFRAALEAILIILLLGGIGGYAGFVGTWAGATLDAKFMSGDPFQLNHSAGAFAVVGMVTGGVLGMMFGTRVMLSPLLDKRKSEGVNSSR